MNGIIARNLKQINSVKNAIRYASGLALTNGRKVCTKISAALNRSHDSTQRDLNKIAQYPEELEAHLLSNIIQKNHNNPGYLIVDSTVLIKEYAENIEGVSYQHSGSKEQPGIGVTAVVWTDLVNTEPVALSMWKKGDSSKVKTATDLVISLAQKTNAQAVLADGVFASIESIKKYTQSHVFFIIRFHSNRVISVPGFEGSAQVKNHEAFKFRKNQRYIVREVLWHDIKLNVIALKIKHHVKGWMTMFLVTNLAMHKAKGAAKLYKHRWKIETFFRTCKQNFGLAQCQARSLRQQKAHCLSVFLAYSKFNKLRFDRSNRKINTLVIPRNADSIRSLMLNA